MQRECELYHCADHNNASPSLGAHLKQEQVWSKIFWMAHGGSVGWWSVTQGIARVARGKSAACLPESPCMMTISCDILGQN